MIKEVTTLDYFNSLAINWNCPNNKFFWTTQSCRMGRNFHPDSIEQNFRNLFIDSQSKGEILPYIKIWSFEKDGKSIAGCVFRGEKNVMMNEIVFEEILWQMNGKYAKSIEERKIMLELLNHAEQYAKQAGFKAIVLSRDPALHNFTREKNSGINNYYTRNGYEASSIKYTKTLN